MTTLTTALTPRTPFQEGQVTRNARRIVFWRLVAVLAAPAPAVALAPAFGALHWSFDLAASFAVQGTAATLLVAAVLATARRWPLATLYALLGGMGAAGIVPDWLPAHPPPATRPGSVRLQSLNLLRDNLRHADAASRTLADADADVVFLSELTPEWQRALAPALAAWPHRIEQPDPGSFGVGLYSRWPLRDATIVPLPFAWAPAVRAVVGTPSGDLGVLAVHTPRPGFGHRSHERDQGLRAMPAELRLLPAAHVVIGDCNATPWTHAFRQLRIDAGLGAGTTAAWRPTWPAGLPRWLCIPIDHVLPSRRVVLLDADVGASFGSDHLPLVATVAFVDDGG